MTDEKCICNEGIHDGERIDCACECHKEENKDIFGEPFGNCDCHKSAQSFLDEIEAEKGEEDVEMISVFIIPAYAKFGKVRLITK